MDLLALAEADPYAAVEALEARLAAGEDLADLAEQLLARAPLLPRLEALALRALFRAAPERALARLPRLVSTCAPEVLAEALTLLASGPEPEPALLELARRRALRAGFDCDDPQLAPRLLAARDAFLARFGA